MVAIDAYLSLKIRRVSLLMALLVVAHHSYVGWGTPWQCLFDGICNNSVPYFFCLSGFLMFRKYDGTMEWLKHTLDSRVRSLMIPYLVWMLVGLILLFTLNCFGLWSDPIDIHSTKWWLGALGITGAPYGLRYLWFVRRLLIFCIFAPIFGIVVKRTGLLLSCVALFCYAVLLRSADVWQSLSFFAIGIWLALHWSETGIVNRRHSGVLLLAVAVLALTALAFHYVFGWWWADGDGGWHLTIDRLLRYSLAWGWIALIWRGYDFVSASSWMGWWDRWTDTPFFVYCFHGILWRLVREFNLRVDAATCWGYISCITITSIAVCKVLKKRLPLLYKLLSGGR